MNRVKKWCNTPLSVLVSFFVFFSNSAFSADKGKTIRQLNIELQQLKLEYLNEIRFLKDRLYKIEGAGEVIEDDLEELAIEVSQKSNQKAANSFNPSIGVILNSRLVNHDDNSNIVLPGYFLAEDVISDKQGFQLGESELSISANVDDQFYASVTIAFGDSAEVEEAYLQTLNLGNGFNIKLGRFFSGIGYLASKHMHTDDFSNRPLVYDTFLAGQFGDDGLQTTWLASTDLYWESGVELFRGDSFPAAGAGSSGMGTLTVFSHIGNDIGDSQSWRLGLSYLQADSVQLNNDAGANFYEGYFSGKTKLVIADFIYKWAPNGNRKIQEFKLQGEYISSTKNGSYNDSVLNDVGINYVQHGWYVESVYRISQQWRMGLRASALSSDKLSSIFNNSFLNAHGYSPLQYSLMFDWSHSEFSRIRFQYDQNRLSNENKNENIWGLQYIASFGVHGAHSF